MLDDHPARDRLTMVPRERFEQVRRELWARAWATSPTRWRPLAIIARVPLEAVLDASH